MINTDYRVVQPEQNQDKSKQTLGTIGTVTLPSAIVGGVVAGVTERFFPITQTGQELHSGLNSTMDRLYSVARTIQDNQPQTTSQCWNYLSPSSYAGQLNHFHQNITKNVYLYTPVAPIVTGMISDMVHEGGKAIANKKTIGETAKAISSVPLKHLGSLRIRDLAYTGLIYGGYFTWFANRKLIDTTITNLLGFNPNTNPHVCSGHMFIKVLGSALWMRAFLHEQRHGRTSARTAATVTVVAWAALEALPTFVTTAACHTSGEILTGTMVGLGIAASAYGLSTLVGRGVTKLYGDERIDTIVSRAWRLLRN